MAWHFRRVGDKSKISAGFAKIEQAQANAIFNATGKVETDPSVIGVLWKSLEKAGWSIEWSDVL